MKTSGCKLPKGKLERLKNAMNRALKGVRRIAVMFNKAMAQSGEDIKIGKTSVYKILVEYGILGIKKGKKVHSHLKRPKKPFTRFAMDFTEERIGTGEKAHIFELLNMHND